MFSRLVFPSKSSEFKLVKRIIPNLSFISNLFVLLTCLPLHPLYTPPPSISSTNFFSSPTDIVPFGPWYLIENSFTLFSCPVNGQYQQNLVCLCFFSSLINNDYYVVFHHFISTLYILFPSPVDDNYLVFMHL